MTSATPDPPRPAAPPISFDRLDARDPRQEQVAAPTRISREALEASLRRGPRSRSSGAVLDRESILLATAACLDDVGYDGTTIRRIARELGCAVGSIYRYYADKRELLAAVCDWRFEAVRAAADSQTLKRFAELYLAVARERPESYRLMFWLAALSPASGGSAMPGVVREIVETWSRRLGSRVLAERTWFHLHGRAMLGQDLREADLPALEADAPTREADPPTPHATDGARERGQRESPRIAGLDAHAEPTPAWGQVQQPSADAAASVASDSTPDAEALEPDAEPEPADDLTLL